MTSKGSDKNTSKFNITNQFIKDNFFWHIFNNLLSELTF